MRWCLIGAMIGVGFVGSPVSSASEPARPAKSSVWMTDYQAAREQARQTGKPLFVVFR